MITNNTLTPLPTVSEIQKMTAEEKANFVESRLRSTKRPGMDKVIEFLRNTDFYTAPSSANHHSNYMGGLVEHSILVYTLTMKFRDIMIEERPELVEKLPEDSVIISALLHDLCKVCFYIPVEKWKKDSSTGNEQWMSYHGYDVVDTFPIGHGEKSVIMLLNMGLSMTPDEQLAIRFHMGCWDGAAFSSDMKRSYARAMDMCPLMILLQNADQMSSLMLETQNNK